MISHKSAYLCFTVRRTFYNFYKSTTKPPDANSLNSSIDFSFGSSETTFTISNIPNIPLKKPAIDPKINGQHYDLAIIGGGSAGLSLANVTSYLIY